MNGLFRGCRCLLGEAGGDGHRDLYFYCVNKVGQIELGIFDESKVGFDGFCLQYRAGLYKIKYQNQGGDRYGETVQCQA